ncbi:PBP2a family beta-lactam-resistant peptidoglycan transpeptidase MecC3 [Staphylococcus caeli]|uniref:Beta-lactam-inducible penicillin-binding protein n=1 Tax=Staphylococcus caeli TaxID=2201815 RepID=A0A1D4NPI7_9STAP|nr:PBP2a family beta-lactam-resistant peptidoglycan transpeptidase MecC3 [Staphylococcus caeli]AWM30253.1 penicillin-binding protein 2 prime [Staphylococcus caeli]SCT12600.1 beta-lactam-inducible penicillin-binding protein [Staphylococcus caeli]SCT51244.1 beta-lactam-inducible penicillin-binding protein [Staphylococcus caeli]
MKKIYISVLVLLLTIIIITWLFRDDDIEKTINAIEKGDYNKIYKNSSETSKLAFGEEEIIDRNKKIHKDLGVNNLKITNHKTKKTGKDKKQVDVKYNMYTKYGTIRRNSQLNFIYEDKHWKLDWDQGVIIPGLKNRQKINIETLKSERGKIIDRNGIELAKTGNAYEIGIVPNKTPENKYSDIARDLQIDTTAITNKVNQKWVQPDSFVPIKKVNKKDESIDKLIKSYNLQINTIKSRVYPLNKATAHLLGYVGPINSEELQSKQFKNYSKNTVIGKKGLERLYDKQLQNTDGFRVSIANTYENKPLDTLLEKKAKNGKDLYLTIDTRVQESIYKNMKNDYGSGTALQPKTGEILALVSTPSYDIYPFMNGISNHDYHKLSNNKKEPFLNKFQITTSPGSTQKILTSIIALKENKLNNNTNFDIYGKGWQKDESWGDYNITRFKVVDGKIDLKQAIESSDNIFFARIALALGAKKFEKGMKDLGVGENIPSDYPFYKAQISNSNLNNDILLADSGYGQGEILVNPIQILSIYSALENNGNIQNPHVLRETKSQIWKKSIISKKDIGILTNGMERVVTKTHRDDIYKNYARIIGKSGTAELKMKKGETGRQIGWFVSYDKNNPNMLMAINIKDVQNKGMASYNAAISGKVYDDLYDHGNTKFDIDK